MAYVFGPSWRTTIAGIAVVALAVWLYVNGPAAKVEAGALVMAGLGLLKAADSKR